MEAPFAVSQSEGRAIGQGFSVVDRGEGWRGRPDSTRKSSDPWEYDVVKYDIRGC